MEDILNKNIFDDKDLCKLSPDYSPTDLVLRMQMRRTIVKDTHSHGASKSDQSQSFRKTIQRGRDSSKMTKEIVNIRNGFNKINLKNQIMLKNAIKNIDNSKSKDLVTYIDNDVNKRVDDDIKTYIKEITENSSDLVVCSDSDFKISDNPKADKVSKDIRSHITENTISMDNLDENKKQLIQDVLRVECTFNKTLDIQEECTNQEIKHMNINEKDNDYNLSTSRICDNKHVKDLQALLIMMALSPKSNENENTTGDTVDNKYKDISDEEDVHKVNNHNLGIRSNTVQSEDINEILNVIPIRIEINVRQKYILKKYVEKWRAYVYKKKDYLAQQRQETLNIFFDKLAKKKMDINQSKGPNSKAKTNARDYSTYQHRYKVQRHIIALQKAKLEEQNRTIEELKYNKIIEASKLSVDDMREEVRKTYYEIDRHLKPKIKYLTNELHIPEIEEPSLVLHCLKVPQFLQRMEKRAQEREEKHAMIRERRRQMEEERLRVKQQAELDKAEMDKEEKAKRIKELREKRKREKIENIRKKQHAERMRSLIVMADLHYEKTLISKYGIRPLRLLMEIKQDNIEMAKAHYKFQLKKNIFLHWMWYTEDMWFERNYKAEDFNRKKILRKFFRYFKQNHHEYVLKKQVAEDYYDLYATQWAFRTFCEGIAQIKHENDRKWQKAVKYHNSNLLFRTFTCWRTLPALNALQREQEFRKARWREKVLQVVPDYCPPDDYFLKHYAS